MFYFQDVENLQIAVVIRIKKNTIVANSETILAQDAVCQGFCKRKRIFLKTEIMDFFDYSLRNFSLQFFQISPGVRGIDYLMHV